MCGPENNSVVKNRNDVVVSEFAGITFQVHANPLLERSTDVSPKTGLGERNQAPEWKVTRVFFDTFMCLYSSKEIFCIFPKAKLVLLG